MADPLREVAEVDDALRFIADAARRYLATVAERPVRSGAARQRNRNSPTPSR